MPANTDTGSVPFDRAHMTSYWRSILTITLSRVVSAILNVENIATLKSRSRVNQGHWKLYHLIDWVWFGHVHASSVPLLYRAYADLLWECNDTFTRSPDMHDIMTTHRCHLFPIFFLSLSLSHSFVPCPGRQRTLMEYLWFWCIQGISADGKPKPICQITTSNGQIWSFFNLRCLTLSLTQTRSCSQQ